MSLAVPAALFLAALAIPIIGLYILKVRLRRIPVSTNLFWRQVYDEKPPRSLWQQLRHWLSLLAQLLLLLLIVFALADPYFSWQESQARR
ncbi:MAG: BatA domain-containing protein, partial [Planctomycetota bacterium]